MRRLAASASGLTPFSIMEMHMERVRRSRWQFWEVLVKTKLGGRKNNLPKEWISRGECRPLVGRRLAFLFGLPFSGWLFGLFGRDEG